MSTSRVFFHTILSGAGRVPLFFPTFFSYFHRSCFYNLYKDQYDKDQPKAIGIIIYLIGL